MIPLELKIKGLYSYLDEQIIDFSKLLEAGLFGIFGKVGSGKSSILEAMAFSIYGRTERFLVSGDNRYYNMLNLKSNDATIQFKFIAGSTNTVFVSQVRFTRNRNNFEDVKLANHDFYKEENGELIPITKAEIETAVGISYENFRRTIIIPQGQFKEFLELGPTDRTKMLKELFGLQRFDLSMKAALIETSNKEKLSLLEGELKGYEGVSLEAVTVLEEELKTVLTEFKLSNETAIEQEKILKSLDQIKENFRKLADLTIQLKQYEEQEIKDLQQEIKIAEYEKIHLIFRQLFDEANEFLVKNAKAKEELEILQASQKLANEQLGNLNVHVEELKEKQSLSESRKKKAGELDKLIEIISEKAKSEKIIIELNVHNSNLELLLANETKWKNEKLEQDALIQKLEKELIPEEKLYAIKSWFDKLEGFTNQIQTIENKENELEKEISAVNFHLEEVRKGSFKFFFDSFSSNFDLHELDIQYTLFKDQLNNELAKKRNQLTEVKIQLELHKFSVELEDGKPCVLCGSLHHPSPLNSEHSHELYEDVSTEIKKSEENLLEIEKVKTLVSKFLNDKENLFIQKKNLLEEKEKIVLQKSEVLKQAPVSNYSEKDKSEFEEVLKNARIASNSILENKRKSAEIVVQLDQLQENKKVFDQTITQYKIQLAEIDTVLSVRRKEVTELNESDYDGFSADEMRSKKEAILRDIALIEEQFAAKTKEKSELEITIAGFAGKIQLQEKVIVELQRSQEENKTKIQQKLIEVGKSEATILEILHEKIDVENVRKQITNNRAKLNAIKGEKLAVEKQVEGKEAFDPTDYEQKLLAWNETKARVSILTEAKGKLESQQKKLQEDLAKKASLFKEQEALTVRAADINTLKRLFSANGFVEFVSRRYLQNVVALANVRFQKMVRQKYKLELSAKGEFLVRDFMNNGKTRSLKSLSGGQTFQAAFCLALALSENIQRNAGVEQHFFFLDEGFGTLDKDNLQIVFDTLKSLRNENRIVGLISHVEELQQEMDVFLKIENDSDNGTRVIESWN